MTKKKAFIILLLWIILLWFVQIIRINKESAVSETQFNMGETFEWGGVKITPVEAHMYTLQEYNEAMGTSAATDGNDDNIICLKLNVVNDTDKDIDWNALFNNLGYGFETTTWCSSMQPSLEGEINIFYSEMFKSGTSQDIWLATTVERDCFKKDSWEKVPAMDYSYVLSVYPNPVKIKMTF